MHRVERDAVRRLFPGNKSPQLIEIRENATHLLIDCIKGNFSEPHHIRRFVVEWLDLDRDINPFYRLLQQDPDLSDLAHQFRGFRMVGIPDLFEALVWCILGQQINLSFAYTLKRRLVERFGTCISFAQHNYFLFPEPSVLHHVSVEDLRTMQLTEKKAQYIKTISDLFYHQQLSKEKLKGLGSEEKMLEELIAIRGIGEWTANYVLMKSLRAMNRVPYGDSGINGALFRLKQIPKKNNRSEVDKVFDQFEGWKTYLTFYLWRSNSKVL